jgi:hypothetical protein
MIACLFLAFPTSGYGPVCTFIEDRDGDGRIELDEKHHYVWR